MPIKRYTGDDNKEYYSADGGKTFNVIEKAKGDDGNTYEKLTMTDASGGNLLEPEGQKAPTR